MVYLCSVLLANDPDVIPQSLGDTTARMEEREYPAIEQSTGSLSQQHALDRANYVEVLDSCTSPPGVWR